MTEHDKPPPQDDDFLQRAADHFDDSVESLDAQTRSRLNQGRQLALTAAGERTLSWQQWLPAGVAAAVALVAIGMWNNKVEQDVFDAPDLAVPAMAADLELLMDEDELEMLEDLEFYSWIDLDEDTNDTGQDAQVG